MVANCFFEDFFFFFIFRNQIVPFQDTQNFTIGLECMVH